MDWSWHTYQQTCNLSKQMEESSERSEEYLRQIRDAVEGRNVVTLEEKANIERKT
jgi:hypothetical protein